ncbi:hypothetical protein MIH18_23690 (plasmid) [Marinobacter sp. M3C]|jgi:hypothetical protein|uniref:hypothetical protein n=1 Tax=Marinobacter sp. M3C TaxID=2917715 RepID=UPI00200F07B2|nr:hypothetical protein [Marinobacter sp. M3C]MCL1485141.1 hypothetical protein [Marinobacter sp.]UQG62835.1 hypothetical protein MIH18_23690 [Marinobacter sp. M3C]
MAMTERTPESKAVRIKAEKVVDRFIVVALACEQDLAWQGIGVSGKIADFEGEIPQSSAYYGVDKMPGICDRMQKWPEDFAQAQDLMKELKPEQRQALVLDRAFRGRTKAKAIDPFEKDKPVYILWDDAACAHEAGCKVGAFVQRVSSAYSRLEGFMAGVRKKAA